MESNELPSFGSKSNQPLQKQRLLLIGPAPHREGGMFVSFELMLEYLGNFPHLRTDCYNLPIHHPLYHEDGSIGHISHLRTIIGVLCAGVRVPRVDTVVIFGTSAFCFSYGTILVLCAKLFRKRCVARTGGGQAVSTARRFPGLVEAACLTLFQAVDRFVVETKVAWNSLPVRLRSKTAVVKCFRPRLLDSSPVRHGRARKIKFAFVTGPERSTSKKPTKGLDILLDACDYMMRTSLEAAECIEVHVYGPRIPMLAKRAQRTPGVIVHGPLPNVQMRAELRHHDALAFPSRFAFEGHPGVIVEAFMAALPVVASDLPGPLEIVEQEVNGLVVPTGDFRAFAAAMNRLATDHELRRRLSAGARASAADFDQERVLQDMVAALGLLPAAMSPDKVNS